MDGWKNNQMNGKWNKVKRISFSFSILLLTLLAFSESLQDIIQFDKLHNTNIFKKINIPVSLTFWLLSVSTGTRILSNLTLGYQLKREGPSNYAYIFQSEKTFL